ncbi:MAG TPA: ROK family protein [Anaerolineae bacterium]|nr:ROK family protein [Anaerolineae bacterium]HIQ12288.1 ROK family protein [Caldilineales bacterium]
MIQLISRQDAKPQRKKIELMPSYYIGIDIGGTKILAAVATPEGRIIARAKRKTLPKSPDRDADPMSLARRIAKTARKAMAQAGLDATDIAAAGVGAPGPTDIRTGRVLNAVNLPGWQEGFDLGPVLRELLGMPIFVDNDVNVGLLGEAAYGAVQDIDDAVGLFVGTGLGGAIMLGGELRRGFRWSAGEVGHTYLYWPGKRPKNIEDVASRGAISRRLAKAVRKGKSPILAEILAQRGDDRITSGVIRRALVAGDPITRRTVARAQETLAVLIASITNFLDPQAFVLGGGLVESLGEPFLEPIRERARELFFVRQRAEEVRIAAAALGDDAGVLGGVALALEQTTRKQSESAASGQG